MPEHFGQIVIGLCMGIALAAATGFRVFVPMLVLSFAAQTNPPMVHLGSGFGWIGSPVALVLFASATVVEIAGYYVPWIDNLLDTLATPAAVVAGILATAAVMGDADPALKWALAIIAGGGIATAVQVLTVATRAASTATTGGVGNPVVSTAEAAGSIVVAILAVVVPVIIAVAILLLIGWLTYRLFFRRRKPAMAVNAPSTD